MTESEWLEADAFYARPDADGMVWHYSIMLWIVHIFCTAI